MMKKTFYYIAAAVLTLGLASCAKEAVVPEEPATSEVIGQMTIVANIEDGSSTKATLSGDDQTGYQVLWSEGDKIILVREVGGLFSTEYTLSEGAGSTSGAFVGASLADGDYMAYYAYYRYEPEKFGEQTADFEESVSHAPMTAKFTVSGGVASSIVFRNACGLLCLNLKGTGTVKSITISTNEGLVSHYANFREDGSMGVQDPKGNPALRYITLGCGCSGRGLTESYQSFYIALPPNDYTGVKIDISDFAGHTFTKTLKAEKSLNIARAQITPVAFSVTGLTNDDVPLTWDSPVGTVGMLYGRECVVVDLGGNVGKMAIATKNVGASSPTAKGTEMTWQNAVNQQNSDEWGLGWRLPSKEEIEALQNFQSRKTSNSFVLNIADGVDLEFPLNGAGISSLSGKSVIWGSDLRLENTAHLPCSMVDGSLYINPALTKTNKTCVRPIHRLPITRNTPVDAVGFISGEEGVVYELNLDTGKTKVVIALKNADANNVRYNYEDDKVRYNCYGAMTTYENISHFIFHGGWYLPTVDEMIGLCSDQSKWGYHYKPIYIYKPGMDVGIGEALRPDDAYNLEFPVLGGEPPFVTGLDYGSYWTSTEAPDGGMYLMFVFYDPDKGTMYVDPIHSHPKSSKAAIRPFHPMP
ncbi:MAG: hypothetical protein MJZ16_12225 [Bacteroidales bacterium]|nr:hypothetical protein [Bacteroidales bacterium]